ncbi:MAG: tyrosine-protein phosphatase [Ruminococcaceae bacterium]|nr:tyrosine-protein phosphatase [Oscillospiraceae bacterium]
MEYRRLPLEGLTNARELGGWNTPDGGQTRHRVYLRTEVPNRVTEKDKQFLRNYGVVMDIDLRGSSELEDLPDLLRDEPWLEYVHLPMFDEHASAGSRGGDLGDLGENKTFSWGPQYVRMVEKYRPWVKDVLEAIARAKGAVMFHCATGKDRTGIVSAILLSLCDVDCADIVDDYSVSEIHLDWIYTRTREKMTEERKISSAPFFSTAPDNMRTLLRHWEENYGGVRGYLRSCGVTEECMDTLRARLLG